MPRYLAFVNGLRRSIAAISSSSGAADADKIICTDAVSGFIDPSFIRSAGVFSFQIGPSSGLRIRSQLDALEARNTADTALAPINISELRINDSKINFGVACRAFHSVDQSIASGTSTVLNFNSERYDTASLHSTSSNTSRLIAPVSGYYHIGACVSIELNSAGSYRQILLRANGATIIALMRVPPTTANLATALLVSTDYYLAGGEYVEVLAVQNSGAALNAQALGSHSPEFWMHLIV